MAGAMIRNCESRMRAYRRSLHRSTAVALLFAGAAAAQDLGPYRTASDRFATLVAAASTPADLQTTEVDDLIRVLTDERSLRSRTYTSADIGYVLDLCDASNKASVSLVLFDLKSHVSKDDTPQQAQAKVVALGNDNLEAFQDQLEHLQPFLLRCQAIAIPLLTEFFLGLPPDQRTEVRLQALRGARGGIVEIFVGALQGATDTRLRESYRLALLTSLAETAPQFASVLPLPARRQLHDAVAAAPQPSGAIGVHLQRIAAALDDSRCESLCTVD